MLNDFLLAFLVIGAWYISSFILIAFRSGQPITHVLLSGILCPVSVFASHYIGSLIWRLGTLSGITIMCILTSFMTWFWLFCCGGAALLMSPIVWARSTISNSSFRTEISRLMGVFGLPITTRQIIYFFPVLFLYLIPCLFYLCSISLISR